MCKASFIVNLDFVEAKGIVIVLKGSPLIREVRLHRQRSLPSGSID